MVAARSEATRAAWESGKVTAWGRRKKADYWTPEQDAALKALLGRFDTQTIAERLTERFGFPRTEGGVRARIKILKLSRLTVRPWSRAEVARALGVTYHVVSKWVALGALTGTPWKLGGGQRKGAVSQAFAVADVENFVRQYPTWVRPAKVRDPGLRSLAELVTRGARPLTLPEAARMAGVPAGNLRYWVEHGKVPSAHRVGGRFWRISASDLPLLRSMPDLRTRVAREHQEAV